MSGVVQLADVGLLSMGRRWRMFSTALDLRTRLVDPSGEPTAGGRTGGPDAATACPCNPTSMPHTACLPWADGWR